MKKPKGFGMPERRRRFSMQFGCDVRPSLWQDVKSHSHLIIAAVGTVALLGVAGTGFWLAMPAGDRQAFAQAESSSADDPAADVGAFTSGIVATAPASAEAAILPSPEAADDVATIGVDDPRWSGSARKQARSQAAAALEAQLEPATAAMPPPPLPTPEQAASVAAYQSTSGSQGEPSPDRASTAAIPTPRPESAGKADRPSAATGNGHILRAVTLRSGPKKAASALGTVPAKAVVDVIACKSWCEIVYQGTRGFIYKSFLKRDG